MSHRVISRPRAASLAAFPAQVAFLLTVAALLWTAAPPRSLAQDVLPEQGALDQDARRVTFDEAVRIALDQNLQLKRADNVVRLQEISVSRNRMDFFPNLTFSAGGTQQYGRNFSLQEGAFINETSEFASLGASSSINLFNGFRDVASLNSAQLSNAAADQGFERTRQDVVFQVMERFITLVANDEQVRVLEEELAYQQQLLERVEEFVEVGTRPSSELYQQRAAEAEAELAVLEAQQALQISETQLIQVLQLDPFGAYRFEAPEVERVELAEVQYDFDQLVRTAYERRADLDAGQLQVQAAGAQVRVARGGYFPRLDLSAGYGSGWSSVARIPVSGSDPIRFTQPAFFDQLDNRRSGSLGLSLSLPVFDRLETRNNVEQAQVQLQNARYDLQDLQQDVALQVRQAYLNYETAEKALDVTATRLQAAEQAREVAEARYTLGAAPFLELAEANANYVNAASARVRAVYDFLYRKKLIDYYLGVLDPSEPLFLE